MFDFIFSLWLCRVCLSVWRQNVGSDVFSKTERFNDVFSKTSRLNICSDLHFFFSPPRLHGCDFLFLQSMVACVLFGGHLSICVWNVLWGDQTRKRVFLRFRDTVFQSEERTRRRRCEDINKKVSIFYCCLFALLKAMNLFHLYKK